MSDATKIWFYRLWFGTQHKSSRFRPWAISGIFLLLAVTTAISAIYGKSWVHAFRQHQALNLLETSRGFEKSGSHSEAFRVMHKSYEKAPDNPTILRNYARLCVTYRLNNGFHLFKRLRELNLSTTDDELLESELHLQLQNTDEAAHICEQILLTAPAHPDAINLYARILAAAGQIEPATFFFKRSLECELARRKAACLIPTAHFFFTNTEAAAVPKKILTRLTTALITLCKNSPADEITDIQLAQCFRIAALSPALNLTQREFLSNSAWSKPELPLSTRIDLLTSAPFTSQQNIVFEKILIFEKLPIPDQCIVISWLNAQAEYSRIFELLSPDLAVKHQELCQLYLGSVIALNRTDIATQLLARKNLPLPPNTIDMLRVMLRLTKESSPIARDVVLRSVIIRVLSELDTQSLFSGLWLALRYDLDALALDAIGPLLTKPALAPHALDLWDAHIRKSNRSALEVLKLCKRSLNFNRKSTRIKINELYLRLLVGSDMEIAVAEVHEIAKSGNNQAVTQILLAFAHYREHLKLGPLPTEDFPPNELSTPQRLIVTLCLVSAGEFDRASEYYQWITSDNLLQEERELFDKLGDGIKNRKPLRP